MQKKTAGMLFLSWTDRSLPHGAGKVDSIPARPARVPKTQPPGPDTGFRSRFFLSTPAPSRERANREARRGVPRPRPERPDVHCRGVYAWRRFLASEDMRQMSFTFCLPLSVPKSRIQLGSARCGGLVVSSARRLIETLRRVAGGISSSASFGRCVEEWSLSPVRPLSRGCQGAARAWCHIDRRSAASGG